MQPYAKSVQNYLNLNKKIYPYFFAVIFASFDLITKYIIRVNNIQEQVIIDNFSPTKLFIKVDFPTLGFPIIFINPDLCTNQR